MMTDENNHMLCHHYFLLSCAGSAFSIDGMKNISKDEDSDLQGAQASSVLTELPKDIPFHSIQSVVI